MYRLIIRLEPNTCMRETLSNCYNYLIEASTEPYLRATTSKIPTQYYLNMLKCTQ